MSDGGEGRAAAALALRLSLAEPAGELSAAAATWRGAHAFARSERLAALAWHRSGDLVRRAAPPEIAEAWRADSVAELSRALRRSAELHAVLEALESAEVEPIVLKGLPLGERLYGSTSVRPSADLDLFVAATDRAAAHAALVGAGWSHLSGVAPSEGIYALERRGVRQLLEVHSDLADDALLRHLRAPAPELEWREIDGRRVRAQSGDFLPAYLAIQLAKHASSPLLRLLDLATLWSQLDASTRTRARRSARGAGAARMLEWALRLADQLPAAARGDGRALGSLGIAPDGRVRRGHNALRIAALAPSPAAALRVAAAWAWPNEEGRGAEFLARRIARVARAVRPARISARASAGPALGVDAVPDESRTVDGRGLVDLVGTVVADAGGGLWIRAYGQSMVPAVPNGARVHLRPIVPSGARRGDVVFAVTERGALVHRVVARWRERVVLQGDAMAWSDPPVLRSHLLATVDAVEVDAHVVPISERPRPTLLRRARRFPRQLAVLCGLVNSAPPRPLGA